MWNVHASVFIVFIHYDVLYSYTYGHIVAEADERKVQAVRCLRSVQPTHRVLHVVLGAKRSVPNPRRCRPRERTEHDVGVALDRFFSEPQFVPMYERVRGTV